MSLEHLFQLATGELSRADAEAAIEAERQVELRQPVPPYIPEQIQVAFIGEAPGEEEVRAGRPFVGRAGDELRHWCELAGVDFSKAYLDNVYPYFNAESFVSLHIDVQPYVQAVQRRLIEVQQRIEGQHLVVVLLGNLAMRAFLGYEGVLSRRGSVYTMGTSAVRYISMLNPAAVLRNQSWRRRCIFDMQKVRRLIEEPSYTPPQLTHHLIWCEGDTEPKAWKAVLGLFWSTQNTPPPVVAVDIETAALDDRITCVGFSWDTAESVTLQWPLDDDVGAKANWIREKVKQLCESPAVKVLHNGLYDAWWLKRYAGIEVTNWQYDTLGMAHALYSGDGLSLEYLTSIYTDIPYYKNEGKDHFGHAPTTSGDWEQLMTYCGRDAVATRQVWWKLHGELLQAGLLDFYLENYPEKFGPMLDLMLRGVRMDNLKRRELRIDSLSEAVRARDALMPYNDGEPMFRFDTKRDEKVWHIAQAVKDKGSFEGELFIRKTANTYYKQEEILKSLQTLRDKTVSNHKLQTLLYDKMGLPIQYERRSSGTETPTTNDLTLRKLRIEYGEARPEVAEVIKLVSSHRKAHKIAEFCSDSAVDDDGRFRFSLGLNPYTGRFSSSRSPKGIGKNAQNQPRDKRVRRLFLPEEGHILLKVDMSQVEARICFVYTGDPELIRLAQLRPGEYDQHSENAVICGLAKSADAVPGPARQTAKKVVHGAQRNMQAPTLLDSLLKDADLDDEDLIIPTLAECEAALEAYHRRYPAIRGRFFEETRREAQESRMLVNSWGRRWPFQYEDIDDELMRKAFSFYLQSECADLINKQGFVPMHRWLRQLGGEARLMLHAHDELVFSCPLNRVWMVAKAVRDMLECPHTIRGVDLSVPIEFGLGSSWAVDYEWKELPAIWEMEDAASEILSRSS
jgi:uracil-DNA glycosylase family 4